MADTKISALPASTTPLAGTEVLPLVQSGATKKVAVSDLTTGRSVSFASATSSQNVSTGFIAYSAINTSTANTTGKVIAVMSAKGYDTVGTPKDVTLIQYEPLDANNVNGDLVIKNRVGDALATVARFTANDYKIETGNLVISTSGKGIDFSATPGTGTSELLADYEEGTWTPLISADGLGTQPFTTVSAVGSYTKVGRQVTVVCEYQYSSIGAGGGSFGVLTGLPFARTNDFIEPVTFTAINQAAFDTKTYQVFFASTTGIYFQYNNGQGTLYSGAPYMTGNDFPAAGTVRFVLSYFTA